MGKKYSFEEVLKTFNDKDYVLLSKEYINCKEKLQYICVSHKDKGVQIISFDSIKGGHGCTFCGIEKCNSVPKGNRTKEETIIKHFSTLLDVEYISYYFKKGRLVVKYRCRIHPEDGVLEMAYNNIKRSKFLCKSCRNESVKKKTFTQDMKSLNANIDIVSEYKNENFPIKCRCNKCKNTWKVAPRSLIDHPTCPKCRCAVSRSETLLVDILNNNNIKYVCQKRFKDCKDKRALPFDFYLTDWNVLIEYQGEQHYRPIRRGNMSEAQAKASLQITQEHDSIKYEYCKKNNIPLICVPYWERETMDIYIFEELITLGLLIEIKAA